MSEVKLVYQDCYKCPPTVKWYEYNAEIAREKCINIVPMPYYLPTSAELIRKAAKKNVGVPFFTDGTKFAKSIEAFVPKVKTTKKVTKTDGDNSED